MTPQSDSKLCPLCRSPGRSYYKDQFYLCDFCKGIFRPKEHYPDAETEIARYESHNNDVNDPKYQEFVSPITEAILRDYNQKHVGLDFGAGTGPVICKVLQDHGYTITPYDPFFHDRPELLQQTYDYIACCEVIEHFHNPNKEFRVLFDLLNPGGSLYCMTEIFHESIDFDKWYYKNDPTHVFIYQEQTFGWIVEKFGFQAADIDQRLIHFRK